MEFTSLNPSRYLQRTANHRDWEKGRLILSDVYLCSELTDLPSVGKQSGDNGQEESARITWQATTSLGEQGAVHSPGTSRPQQGSLACAVLTGPAKAACRAFLERERQQNLGRMPPDRP